VRFAFGGCADYWDDSDLFDSAANLLLIQIEVPRLEPPTTVNEKPQGSADSALRYRPC
jgi:hypothetical protein